jgi:integrase
LPVDPRHPDGRTFGELPLSQFAEPYIHHDFRESLRAGGRSKPTQDAARKVLSSALSWGAESRAYRGWLPANGAKLTTTRRRRSNRTAARPAVVRPARSRVLNAFDYELVRAELLARTDQRTWEPGRDAALLDLVFGCGLRPEEARGTRWWQVLWPGGSACGVLRVRDVIAAGEVAEGKTVGSLRDARLPLSVAARLCEWRDVGLSHGLPVRAEDFVIPGVAPGGHMTASQEKRWSGRYLKPAFGAVAAVDPARAYLIHATAYAARRGHISSRLAAGESAPAVADDCGTSRKTIIGHYHEDLGDEFDRPYPPFEEQLGRAQASAARAWRPRAPAVETRRCEAGDHDWERPRAPGRKPRSCPEH